MKKCLKGKEQFCLIPPKLLLKMKLTFLVVLVVVFQSFAENTLAQGKISVEYKNLTIEQVLLELENHFELGFMYNKDLVDVERKVDINMQDATIDEILKELFSDKNVAFHRLNNQIVISPKFSVNLQQKSISGKVTDTSGLPLPGVTVLIKGTTNGTVTDADGNYSFTNIPEDATLIFSFVGMKTQEILVAGETSINVKMEEDAIGIEEVVAIGYGTQKKINLTGAVAIVEKEAFENRSTSTPVAALQGAISGVTVTRSSGKPGSEDYSMQIRGFSSVNNVDVLVIVDGVRSSLSDLNANDIESISVLKDAAAAAIYGSNAAGGVVIVTTKKGEKGKIKVNYSGNYGITRASGMPERLKSWVEAKYFDDAYVNSGSTVMFGETKYAWMRGEQLDVIDTYGIRTGVRPSDYPGTNFVIDPNRPNVWLSYGDYDQIAIGTRRENPIQSHNVSLSGGDEKTSYYLSTGYYNRRGILRYGPDSEEKYNVRLNIDRKLSNKLDLSTYVSYTNNNIYQNADAAENILGYMYRRWGWIAPVRDFDGQYHAGNGIWPSAIDVEKNYGKDTRHNYMFEGNMNLKINDLLSGLDINIIGSKRMGFNKRLKYTRTLTYIGPLGTPTLTYNPTNGMLRQSTSSDYTSMQAFANYGFNLDDAHDFKLMGGYSYEDYRYESFYGGINNLVTNDFFSLGWGDAETAYVDDEVITYATMGFFGRLNYNYKEKYLFEANLRYDGSSRLSPDNRWNLFPSLSAGWAMHKEDFFPDNKFITQLKLRASWGQLGNADALGYYDYIGLLYSNSDVALNNAPTTRIYQSQLASPKKTWETIETSNIGADFSFFDNRLSFSGDYYIKKNKNMLANMEVPSIIGIGLPTYNIGELKTWGWEINGTWKKTTGKFHYWISANIADNKNKLTKYEGQNIVNLGKVELIEGMPINTIWGYKTDGLFQSDQEYADYGVFINSKTGEGDMKYLDLNGDKKISIGEGTIDNHGDLVKLGDTTPRYLFGLNLRMEWKGFDFNCFFQGVAKRKFFIDKTSIQPMASSSQMPMQQQIDYWSEDNTDAFWPRPFVNSDHSYWYSDYWVQNGAYIRLKNIELGYTLPKSITQKLSLERVKVSLSGQDVWEYTKSFSFIDPEFSSGSRVTYYYPFFRTFQMGLNVTF